MLLCIRLLMLKIWFVLLSIFFFFFCITKYFFFCIIKYLNAWTLRLFIFS